MMEFMELMEVKLCGTITSGFVDDIDVSGISPIKFTVSCNGHTIPCICNGVQAVKLQRRFIKGDPIMIVGGLISRMHGITPTVVVSCTTVYGTNDSGYVEEINGREE